MYQINFQIFVKAKNEVKALRILGGLYFINDPDYVLESVGPYWKDKSLFEVSISTVYKVSKTADALLLTLKDCNEITFVWNINCADLHNNESFEFRGVANENFRFSGLEWVSFELNREIEA